MKPLSFNISKMKKVSGDKSSTTFKHPDGHIIRVAHAGLPMLQRKQLEKLPIHADEGAIIGDVDPNAPMPKVSNEDIQNALHPQVPPVDMGKEISSAAKDVGTYLMTPAGQEPKYADRTATPAPQASSQTSTNPVANPNIPVAPVATTDTASPSATGIPNINLNSVYRGSVNAINEKAKAEGDFAGAQAQIERDNRQQLVDSQSAWSQQQFDMQTDVANALEDVKNGHINPNHYMESMETPQKISTAIGLLLGSFAGRIGQQNPAQAFLNKQIDRDIEAQKADQNTKLNVYNGYLNTYKNAAAAENMARATQMAIYGSKIREAADKMGTPLAKANADAATAQLKMQMIPLINNAHLINATSQFHNSGNQPGGVGSEAQYQTILNASQQTNPAFYKDAQDKYVPGIGVSSHPLDPKDRETLTQMNELSPLIDRAIADQKNYGMTGAWSAKNRADANADKEALNVSLNKLTGLSRLNGVEYENYGKQIGDIGGVNAGGTLETLKRLKQTADTERNVLMQNNGIKPFSHAQAPSGLDPASQQNLNKFLMNNPGVDQGTAINFLRQKGLIN